MATINEITVKAFNKELAEMLEAFAKKHGLSKGAQRIVYARDNTTGGYAGYSIDWQDVSKKPALFSLSIPDIVAVKVV